MPAKMPTKNQQYLIYYSIDDILEYFCVNVNVHAHTTFQWRVSVMVATDLPHEN